MSKKAWGRAREPFFLKHPLEKENLNGKKEAITVRIQLGKASPHLLLGGKGGSYREKRF